MPLSRRSLRAAATVTAAAAIAHGLPSTLVLTTFWNRPPSTLLRSLCRWRVSTDHRQVALTFDDGPGPATARTLDLLEELEMTATFFLLGSQMRRFPALARSIVDRGHEVAIHGLHHRHHLVSTPGSTRRDLEGAVTAHREVLGTVPRFYRPTYGQLSTAALIEARRHQLEVVLWSRWGKEFAEADPAPVVERLLPGLRPGAILLLHDSDVSCPPGTAERTHAALPLLAGALNDRSLRAVCLGQLIGDSERVRAGAS